MAFAHGLRKLGEAMRNSFAREALEVEPEPPPRPRRARSLGRALFAIEDLPLDPEPPRPPRRPGPLRTLLAPERLAEAPPAAAPTARHRWLAWLFRPESLDPP